MMLKIVGNQTNPRTIEIESELQKYNIPYKIQDPEEFYNDTKISIVYTPSIFSADNTYIGWHINNVMDVKCP